MTTHNIIYIYTYLYKCTVCVFVFCCEIVCKNMSALNSYYAMILGDNYYSCNVNKKSSINSRIQSLKKTGEIINCIGIGPENYYAITCKSGKCYYYGSQRFMEQMQSISNTGNIPKICHITFGCDNQYAITMTTGHCFSYLYRGMNTIYYIV